MIEQTLRVHLFGLVSEIIITYGDDGAYLPHVDAVIGDVIADMSVFHDEVEIEDFEYDEETQTYTYPCPCGDQFQITKVCDSESVIKLGSLVSLKLRFFA